MTNRFFLFPIALVCLMTALVGCQEGGLVEPSGNVSDISLDQSSPTAISPKVSDSNIQELREIVSAYLDTDNPPRNEKGRELDVALLISPTPEDFEQYPDYRFVGKTESGIEYMFLVGDHATDIWIEATNWNPFAGKAMVPNNPDCRGDALASNVDNKEYYECTFEVVLECPEGATTIKIQDEYHTYSNCA